jgi:hypothetical protein
LPWRCLEGGRVNYYCKSARAFAKQTGEINVPSKWQPAEKAKPQQTANQSAAIHIITQSSAQQAGLPTCPITNATAHKEQKSSSTSPVSLHHHPLRQIPPSIPQPQASFSDDGFTRRLAILWAISGNSLRVVIRSLLRVNRSRQDCSLLCGVCVCCSPRTIAFYPS